LAAFEKLYRIYQPRLTRFLSNLVLRPLLVVEVRVETRWVGWETAQSFWGRS
jgi:RNA polymerase sigma-70 factor (ECF subfamily)